MSPLRSLARLLWDDKLAFLSLLAVLLLFAAAIFGPYITPHSPTSQDLAQSLRPPFWLTGGTWTHPLGTDGLGRDVLSRLIVGARTSLFAGVTVVFVAAAIGISLGLIAGYRGGLANSIITAVGDVHIAFPGLLLALLVISVFGSGLQVVIIVLILNHWIVFSRTTRIAVLAAKEKLYVEAAIVSGAKSYRVVLLHILPNIVGPLTSVVALEFARVILAESALSFLGLGVQPPGLSWGLDLATGQTFIFRAWWLITFPGLAIFVTALSANTLSNWSQGLTSAGDREAASLVRNIRKTQRIRQEQSNVELHETQFAKETGTLKLPPATGLHAPSSPPLLEIKDLHIEVQKISGVVGVVKGISLVIHSGQTLGLVGESGSGKTMTAHSITSFLPATARIVSGDVLWKGQSVVYGEGAARLARSLRGRCIGVVQQNAMTSLNPVFTVGTQISQVMHRYLRISAKEARQRTLELLDLVGITSPRLRIKQYPHELSGGMRQRIMIAAALATEPELLIADEPTTALDACAQAQILELLSDIQGRFKLGILFITHDLGVVADVCSSVAVMYAGRIVESAIVQELFSYPGHPYTRGLIKSAPRIDRRNGESIGIKGSLDVANLPPGCPFLPRCDYGVQQCNEMPALNKCALGHDHEVACWRALRQLVQ